MRILGLDPGLRHTGWGTISVKDSTLQYEACGVICPQVDLPMVDRLAAIYRGVHDVIEMHEPDVTAVEEVFVSLNASSTLKLGHARGAALVAAGAAGQPVSEYPARLVKKTVTGSGKAQKSQVMAMVAMLLPGSAEQSADSADALAVAICHALHRRSAQHNRTGSAR